MSPKSKVIIPNILTLSRLVLTPVIIFLGLTKNYVVTLILVVIACITDLFDGKLARKWNTVTDTGAKLDALSDKVFAIGLTLALVSNMKYFLILMILEAIIGAFNLFAYKKTNITKSLMIGKIKTFFLFTTVSLGFLILFVKGIDKFVIGLIFATTNIQVLTLISYIVNFYDNVKNKKVEESIINDKKETRTKVFDIEEYEEKEKKIKKAEKQEKDLSNTKVLNHIKDIFIDRD